MLGELTAVGPDGRIELGGRRQRLVLAILLANRGDRVSIGGLVDAVWSEDAPVSARRTLQSYLSRLRRLVPEGTIETIGDGYRLDPDVRLDAARFEQLAAEGLGLLHTDPEAAGDVLREALELWRGPPYGSLGELPALRTARHRLVERRLEVVEARIQADLDSGRHHGLVAELRALVTDNPSRELLHRQLMHALYLQGRQGEALEVGRRLRDRLVDQLGVEPSSAVQRLQRRILEQDPTLDPASGARVESADAGREPTLPVHGGPGDEDDRAHRDAPDRMVGRDAELAAIVQRLERAAGGDPGVVVLAGDAGVGKTRLVTEVAARASRDGWTVLTGACAESSTGAATLALLADLLRQLAREQGDDALTRLLAGSGRWLAPLMPEIEIDTVDLEDGSEAQVLVAFHRLLGDLAVQQPVLLVLEDLHWADALTRDLLTQLATRLHDERLAVVATVRIDDVGWRHPLRPWLAELIRRPSVTQVDLGPLDGDALTAHLAALAGDDHGLDLPAIAARADGNPFFAEQLLAAGNLDRLPRSLEDVLRLRLERLPGDAQQLLGEVAVLGATVDPALLEAATGLDRPAIGPAVRAALDEGVLVLERAGYALRHALLREVARDRLVPSERVVVHAAAAAALEADPGLTSPGRAAPLSQAAHHWWQARDLPRCLAASVGAADEAGRIFAGRVALEHLRRAIGLWDRVVDPEQVAGVTRLALLQLAARTAVDVDDSDAVELGHAAVRAADAAGDEQARADAVASLTTQLVSHGHELEALEVSTAERARHGGGRTPARSVALSAHAMAVTHVGELRDGTFDLDAVAADLDEALAIARECGDLPAQRTALVHIVQFLGPYLPDRAEEAVAELADLAEASGGGTARLQAHHEAASLANVCGDLGRADRELSAWHALAARHGTRRVMGTLASSTWVAVDTHLGRLDSALARIERLALRELEANPFLCWVVVVGSGTALRWTGQSARALDRVELATSVHDAGRTSIAAAAEIAASRAAAGATPRDVLDVARHLVASLGVRYWFGDVARLVASVAEAADRRPIDAPLLDEVDGWIDRLGSYVQWLRSDAPVRPRAEACLQHASAERAFVAGAPDPDLWDPVVVAFDRRGALPDAAIARLRRAEARAEADGSNSSACEDDVLEAWRVFDELGMTALQDHTIALARPLRIRLPGPTDAGDGGALRGLTRREREVLTLVAQGWSDERAAEHLFMSPRSVSEHLSNAMHRVGAESRGQIIRLAHRAGLTSDG